MNVLNCSGVLCFLFWLWLFDCKNPFAAFRKAAPKTSLGFVFFGCNPDRRRPTKAPKLPNSWQSSACCAFHIRDQSGMELRLQLSPSISNPPVSFKENRHSTQCTNTHTQARTSVSRSRLSELKPSRATWVVVTLYLITFSRAASKCCSRSVEQNLSEL